MITIKNKRLLFIGIIILIIILSSTYALYKANYREENKKQTNIEFEGIVNHIVDGDTLDINDNRIRLALVNTPERGQEGYMKAKKLVQSLCLNKKGEVNIDDGQRRGDRYGRDIGIVYCDGINVNAELMKNNLARV